MTAAQGSHQPGGGGVCPGRKPKGHRTPTSGVFSSRLRATINRALKGAEVTTNKLEDLNFPLLPAHLTGWRRDLLETMLLDFANDNDEPRGIDARVADLAALAATAAREAAR